MSTIESVLQRNPRFPAVPRGRQAGARLRHGRLRGPVQRGRAGLRRASGRGWRASIVIWNKPFTKSLDESERAVLQVVRRRQAQRLLQLPRPATRGRAGDKIAIIFEADDGKVTKVTYKELLRARLPVRQCAEGARHQEGRPRPDLHADVGRRRRRDAGLRPHRRHPLGGVRRLLGQEPAGAHHRRRRASRSSPPTSSAAAARKLPLKPAVDEALALGGCEIDQERDRLQAHRRPRRLERQPRHLVARPRHRPAARPASPSGSTPSIRCSSSTPRAPPASPRACSTPPAATCCRRILTHEVDLRHQADDVFWCTADIGWVTGHTYITYGPLACGATEIVFEGVPTYPDAGRFWKIIQDHKVTIFYTAPTAIRSLIKAGADLPKQLRPVEPAHPRHGRRADQPGGLDVVLQRTSAARAARSSTPAGRPRPAAT